MNLLEAVKKCSPFVADSKDGCVVMTHVARDGRSIIATNGRLMALATVENEGPAGVVDANTEKPFEGSYPDWKRVNVRDESLIAKVELPREQTMLALEMLIKSWKSASKRGGRVDKTSPMTILLEVLGHRAVLSLRDTKVSVAFDLDPARSENWADYETHGYNAEYLLKILKAIEGDEVTLATQADVYQSKASVVFGASDDFKVILMPVRIRE